jgi:hypothetical protein
MSMSRIRVVFFMEYGFRETNIGQKPIVLQLGQPFLFIFVEMAGKADLQHSMGLVPDEPSFVTRQGG